MGPGSLIGIVVGVAICAVLAVVFITLGKKETAKVDAMLANLSDEQKNMIKNQSYAQADGKDMYTTNAYIVTTIDEGEKLKAVLLFYFKEHQEFYTRNAKLTKQDAAAKGIAPGAFVPALMKYDKDMHYFDFKKLV